MLSSRLEVFNGKLYQRYNTADNITRRPATANRK
jgi:hypothetical protein